MTSDGNLDQISKELGEAVKRIEKIQAADRPPFAQRFTNHFRKHGNNLTSLVLAGCLFFVALGRLDLKSSHQTEKTSWQQQLTALEQEKQGLKAENNRLAQQLSSLQDGVRQEANTSARRFGPVAERLKALLEQDSPPALQSKQGNDLQNSQPEDKSQTMI
ncbi:hypothetical protein WJX74_004651 [Apatococcus lobatus]|uniref:Uncharacterized protein n=2 Tax=Apatococcus TaxID=904362 RepID=A0AAW1SPK9_9CHLO